MSVSPGAPHCLVLRERFVNKRVEEKATEMTQKYVQSIGQGLANFTLRVKSSLSPMSVNKVLLKHNHTH